MAEDFSNRSISRSEDLLSRADDLMARHRAQQQRAAQAAVVSPPAANEAIPTLTDYVAEESEVALPELDLPPPFHPTDEPKIETSESLFAAIAAKEEQSFEDDVFARLQEQLDRDLGVMLETRLMPELMGALEQAMNLVTVELQEKMRVMVRDAIDKALTAKVQNRDLPLREDER